jgi:hypothetical protein
LIKILSDKTGSNSSSSNLEASLQNYIKSKPRFNKSKEEVKNQCITRVYAVNSIDEDGWVNPSNIQILDKINMPTNNVYISNDFILKRHKEVIKNVYSYESNFYN